MDLFSFSASVIFSHHSIGSGSLLQISCSSCTGGCSEVNEFTFSEFHRSIPHSHAKIPMKVCPCLLLVFAVLQQQENQPMSHVQFLCLFMTFLHHFLIPFPVTAESSWICSTGPSRNVFFWINPLSFSQASYTNYYFTLLISCISSEPQSSQQGCGPLPRTLHPHMDWDNTLLQHFPGADTFQGVNSTCVLL